MYNISFYCEKKNSNIKIYYCNRITQWSSKCLFGIGIVSYDIWFNCIKLYYAGLLKSICSCFRIDT